LENQSGETAREPILHISPDARTTSNPETISELKPYCWVSRPWPWIITFAAMVAVPGESGMLWRSLG
jgi:hypothetical protein